MRSGALAFLVGVFVVQQLAQLPRIEWCIFLIPIVLATRIWRPLRGVAWAACGFFWAVSVAQWQLSGDVLASEDESIDLVAEGWVAAPPQISGHDLRFDFEPRHVTRGNVPISFPQRVRLSWRNAPESLYVGDVWRLQVRLKRPHGFMNPGGFDYEGWMFAQGVGATGYVRERAPEDDDDPAFGSNVRVRSDAAYRPIEQWRQLLGREIARQLNGTAYAPIVSALAIGTTQDFTEDMWDVLNRTGTTHLISISGLHIGFIAGLVFFITRALWARVARAALVWPAPKAAASAALAAAVLYSALAGFSVPTQRSLIMVAVTMSAVLLARNVQPSRVLAIALLVVLLWDPMSVVQPGFWLSYGAVALLLYGMTARWNAHGLWWKWGRAQWLVTLGMVPLMLVLFQRTSVIAPLANFIAIPGFNVITVPLALMGTLLLPLSTTLGGWLLSLAEWSIHPQWAALQVLAQPQWSMWTQHVPVTWTLFAGLFGILWLFLPRGIPARWLGGVALLPMFLVLPLAPRAGEAWFTLLDVGQGLAAVVRTAHHTLVFDTGPRFNEHFDTGEAVVLPFLRAQGVAKVDTLMLSHGDSDHIGGATSLLRGVPIDAVFSSQAEWIPRTQPCVLGQHWVWDEVYFDVLYPPPVDSPLRRKKDNDVSCVLRVSAGEHRVLLTGDIETPSEKILLRELPEQLRADVIVVPHHGSATSSSEAFVQAVQPRFALYPVGYRNRFHFPKEKVVERYRAAGAQRWDSAHDGAITVRLSTSAVSEPEAYREAARKYWNAD